MIEVKLLVNARHFQEINHLLKELSPGAEPITRDYLTTHYLNPHSSFIYVAVDSDREYPNLVGMATVFFIWRCSGWLAEIHDVVVDPTYRGRHIGDMLTTKLLKAINNFALRENKKITVYLTSKPHRVAANNMYLKHGFELVAKAEGENGTNLYKLVVEPNTSKT